MIVYTRCSTLDDFVAIIPDKHTNEHIVYAYMDLAKEINLPLAPLDNPDKATRSHSRY